MKASCVPALLGALVGIVASCGGGETAAPTIDLRESGSETPDAVEEAGGDELLEAGAEASAEAEIGPEAEVEPPAEAPELSLWLVTATGPKGQTEAEMDVGTADEPQAYLESPGFQLDVAVSTLHVENGRDVTLQVGNTVIGTAKVVVDAEGKGSVTFENVTFTHSLAGYDVKAWAVNDAKLYGEVSKKVRVNTGGCSISVLPSNAGCILADADPTTDGVQVAFTVTDPERTCDTATVAFEANGQSGSSGVVPLDASGSARIILTVFPAAQGIDGVPLDVTATVGDSKNPDRDATAPVIRYTVDLTDPVVDVLTPDKAVLTLADDKDQDPGNGLTIDVGGTVVGIEQGSEVALFVNQTASGTTVPDGQGSWLFANVALAADGEYELAVTGQDACGRTGRDAVIVQAKVTKATYVVLHPSPGGVLLAKDDAEPTANPATDLVYQTTFRVTGEAQAGTTLSVRCRANQLGSHWVGVGSLVVAGPPDGGEHLIPVDLDVAVLGKDVSCQVLDDAANPGSSSEVAFRVALPAPVLKVLAPKAGVYLSEPDVAVSAWAANLEGIEPSVLVLDEGGVSVVPDIAAKPFKDGTATFDVALESAGTPIPDGAYTLVVDATDPLGNIASETTGSVTAVPFTLDTTPPAVAITAPDHDVIDPATNPSDVDADPATPGFQLAFEVSVPTGGGDGTEVCLRVGTATERCAVMAGGLLSVAFPSVTLQPGLDLVQAWAVDLAGHRGDAPDRTIDVRIEGPRVAIVEPAKDGPIASLPFNIVVQVTDRDGNPLAGAAVTLLVAGVQDGSRTTDASGRATFQVASLPEQPTAFVAMAEAAGETSWSDARTLWLKTGKPAISFTTPLAGDIVNLAYGACGPGVDCTLDVLLSAQNCEDGSQGGLTVDCGPGKVRTYQGEVLAGTLRFTGVVLSDQSACSLVATVTDLAGQAAAAGPIQVTVDRRAPVLAFTAPPPGLNGLDYLYDLDPATPGLQYTLRVTVSGAAVGQPCTVTVAGPGGSSDLSQPVPAGANPEVAFVGATLPNGTVLLTARAADAAGNVGTAKRSVQVLAGEPSIRIVSPPYVDGVACTSSSECLGAGVCGNGRCAFPWGAQTIRTIKLTANNVTDETGNLRICSDMPGLPGPECESDGFRQVATGTIKPDLSQYEVAVPGLPDGAHVLIAEAKTLSGAPWVSSLGTAKPSERLRYVFQDTVPPSVQSVTSPSDAAPADDMLNAAEQVAPGVFTVRAAVADAESVTFYVDGSAAGLAPVVDGAATADLPIGGPAPHDATAHEVFAVARDLVGNLSAQPGPVFRPTVDTRPPTLSFSKPSGGLVKCGESQDIVLSSDAVGRTVTLADAGVVKGSAPVDAGGTATFPFATTPVLTDGHHELSAVVSDAAANTTTATRAVDVVTVPPTLTVLAPADGGVLADADDASPGVPGFQVNVSFGAGGADVTTWRVAIAPNCDASFAACDPAVDVASGPVTNPGGVEPAVTPTVVSGTSPRFKVIVRVYNAAGCETAVERRLSLALTQCQVTLGGFTPGGFLNNQLCPVAGTDCAAVEVPVTVTASLACGPVTTGRLGIDGVFIDAPFVGQVATFHPVFQHGTVPVLEGHAMSGETLAGSSGQVIVRVDLADPVVSFVEPSGASVTWGIAADDNGAQAGLQTDLVLSAADDGLDGGRLDALTLDTGTGPQALSVGVSLPLALSGTSQVINLPAVTIADQASGTVAATVRDLAGNAATAAFAVKVDLQRPAAPAVLAPGPNDIDPRRPGVRLRWTAVGDNGTQAGTRAARYDIRYSRTPIDTEAQFTAACRVTDLAYTDPLPEPKVVGTLESFTVTGPDIRLPSVAGPCRFETGSAGVGGYYFAVRVIDAAGNESPIGPESSLSVSDLVLRDAQISSSLGPAGDLNYQRRVWRVGDLNDDGKADLAIGGRQSNGFCIVYGHANPDGTVDDLAISTASGPHHQCFTGTNAGWPVAGVGDVNGDGVDDLAAGEGASAAAYVVKVWFGVRDSTLAPAPNLTIKGFNNGGLVGAIVAGAGDFDGNGVADMAFGSRGENRAYLLPGNAAWTAATNTTIDLQQGADRTANKVVTIQLTAIGTKSPLFGVNASFVRDVDNDGYDELAVAAYTDPGQVVVVRGRPVAGAATLQVSRDNSGAPDDATALRLRPELAYTDPFDAFGVSGLDGLGSFDGDALGDVLVSNTVDTWRNTYCFFGANLAASWGTIVKLGPTQQVGDGIYKNSKGFSIAGAVDRAVRIGNLDNDASGPSEDFALGGLPVSGKIHVRLNVADPGGSFGFGTFPAASPVLVDPADPNGTKFGYNAAGIGDFNGDGFADLLVGTDGSGYAVLLY